MNTLIKVYRDTLPIKIGLLEKCILSGAYEHCVAVRCSAHMLLILYSRIFSLVQTFVKMPPEAPEEIFTLIICDKALRSTAPTGLLNLSAVFVLW